MPRHSSFENNLSGGKPVFGDHATRGGTAKQKWLQQDSSRALRLTCDIDALRAKEQNHNIVDLDPANFRDVLGLTYY